MKLLLLVILFSQTFGGVKDFPVVRRVVKSPEAAAVLLWQENQSCSELGYNKAHLYEIDLRNKIIKEIKIPVLKFKKTDNRAISNAPSDADKV